MRLRTLSCWLALATVPALAQTDFTLAQLPAPTAYTVPSGNSLSRPDLPIPLTQYLAPANASAPGDTYLPALSGATSANAPVIGAVTHQAGPDRSIVIQGANLTQRTGTSRNVDTAVWMYAQTGQSAGRLYKLLSLREDDTSITAVIDSTAAYGMYLLWVTNAAGASQPVRVNATEGWWLGPLRSVPGGSVSLYGRNLTSQNGELTSYIYLRPWGTTNALTQASVTKANPNKVTFTVPSGLAANTDYEVWAHNGHGGQYGWSGPFRLSLASGAVYNWAGKTINVTTFGATPNDSTDDSTAIQNAFNSAVDGDIVQFPSGRFIVTRAIYITRSVTIIGAGSTSTIIEGSSAITYDDAIFRIKSFPTRVRNIGFDCKAQSLYSFGGVLFLDGANQSPNPSGALIDSVSISTRSGAPYTSIGAAYLNDIWVTNSNFQAGQALQANRSFQVFFQNNVVRGNWPDTQYSSQAMVALETSYEVDVSGNDAASLDTTSSPRQTLSRMFLAQGHGHGATGKHYIAENRTRSVGCPSQTCGEQILFETPGTFFTGPGTMTAPSTITFPATWASHYYAEITRTVYASYSLQRPSLVFIQRGRGVGQYRRILDSGVSTLTIDRPWDVDPDTSSIFTIVTGGYQSAVYKNDLGGMIPSTAGTNVGIVAYGAMFDLAASRNTFSNLPRAVELSSLTYSSCAAPGASTTDNICPVWGSLVSENNISGVGAGIVSYSRLEGPVSNYLGTMLTRTVIRDNVINNVISGAGQGSIAEAGVIVGDANLNQANVPWQNGTVVEGNRITDSRRGMIMLGLQSLTALRLNTLTSTGKYTDMTGILFQDSYPNEFLYNNSYSGVAASYGGLLPGSGLRLDNRSVRFQGSIQQSSSVPLRNVGTTGFTPTATADVNWITPSITPSSLPGETSTAALNIAVAPAGLSAGTYQGNITVAGSQNFSPQTVEVSLTVTSSSSDSTPPLVNLTAPAPSAQLASTVAVSATASDNIGVTRVDFLVDGIVIGTKNAAPYTINWDTTTAANGGHTVTARAYDAANNSANASAAVTVYNPSSAPLTETGFVTGVKTGTARNNDNSWVGFRVLTGAANVTVTSLGRWVQQGNGQPHNMKIVLASNGQDVPGSGATIQTAGATPGQFAYAPLAAPVTLLANTAYYIVSRETVGADFWYDFDTALTSTNIATITHAVYSLGDTTTYGLAGITGRSYVPVDFKYLGPAPLTADTTLPTVSISAPANNATVSGTVTVNVNASDNVAVSTVEFLVNNSVVASTAGSAAPYSFSWNTSSLANASYTLTARAVDSSNNSATASITVTVNNTAPAPSPTDASFVTGAVVGRARNDDNSWVGFRVTIGASPVNVTYLGRWVSSGNSQPHQMKIVTADTWVDVAGSGVIVNTAGVTPGQFAYGKLASPVTLNANASYFIVSLETAGGDFWYDFDTKLTSSSVGTITQAVYSFGAKFGLAGVAGRSYVPVDFKYATSNTPAPTPPPPAADTTPPTVSITAPASGATLSGTATFTATASDNVGVNRVEFLVANQIVATATSAPYTATWNTTSVANGNYTLTARAVDSSTLTATASIPIVVSNVTTTQTETKFVSSVKLGATPRNNDDSWVGMRIVVGSQPLTVTSLGRWIASGNTQNHPMKIVFADTWADVPGASATIATAGATVGQYKYAPLTSAVTLQPFTAYFIVSREFALGDFWYDFDTSVTTTTAASVTHAVYSVGTSYGLVNIANRSYVPVDFTYLASTSSAADTTPPAVSISAPANGATVSGTVSVTAAASDASGINRVDIMLGNTVLTSLTSIPYTYSWNTTSVANGGYTLTAKAVDNAGVSATASISVTVNNVAPPPSGAKTFVTTVKLGASPRNNDDSWVGMRILVGAQPVTVTALGRWVVSGNVMQHPMKIVDADTWTDVAGTTVNVATLGATAGQYRYATLTAPVTLQANKAYFIVSREYAFGDYWYDFDTSVTTTSVAAVTQAVYSVGPTFGLAGIGGRSYVPVSFQYQ